MLKYIAFETTLNKLHQHPVIICTLFMICIFFFYVRVNELLLKVNNVQSQDTHKACFTYDAVV